MSQVTSRVITPFITGIIHDDPVSIHNLPDIVHHCYVRSKLKKSGVSVYDKDLRNSFTLYNAVLDMDEEAVIQVMCEWDDAKLGDDILFKMGYNKYEPLEPEYTTIGFDKTIVYQKGGFFASHVDGKVNNSHVGTLLILPPKSLCPYEGGDLQVDSDTFTSDDNDWTLVFIRHTCHHSVQTVTSGTRVVFKYNVFYNPPQRLIPKVEPIPQTVPKPSDEEHLCDNFHPYLEDDITEESSSSGAFDLFD